MTSFRGMLKAQSIYIEEGSQEGQIVGFSVSFIHINDVEKRYTCKKLNRNYQGTEKAGTNERCFFSQQKN